MSFGKSRTIEIPTIICSTCSASVPIPVPESCDYCGNAFEPQARATANATLQSPDQLTRTQRNAIETLEKHPYIPGAHSLLDQIPDTYPGKEQLEAKVRNTKGSHVTTSGMGFSGKV